jgi:hypothetical protein
VIHSDKAWAGRKKAINAGGETNERDEEKFKY